MTVNADSDLKLHNALTLSCDVAAEAAFCARICGSVNLDFFTHVSVDNQRRRSPVCKSLVFRDDYRMRGHCHNNGNNVTLAERPVWNETGALKISGQHS